MQDYWLQRMKDAQQWGILVNFSNIIFQLGAILKPKTPEHKLVNQAYSIFTIFSLGMIYFSYNNPKRRNWLVINLYLISFRQAFRMIDLEMTRPEMEEGQWNWQIVLSVFAFLFTYNYINMVSEENLISQLLRFFNLFSSTMIWIYTCFLAKD